MKKIINFVIVLALITAFVLPFVTNSENVALESQKITSKYVFEKNNEVEVTPKKVQTKEVSLPDKEVNVKTEEKVVETNNSNKSNIDSIMPERDIVLKNNQTMDDIEIPKLPVIEKHMMIL